jgi:hypothetical protein
MAPRPTFGFSWRYTAARPPGSLSFSGILAGSRSIVADAEDAAFLAIA